MAEFSQLRLADLRHLLFAERRFHHVLDGLAMAVPTGNIRGEIAALRMRLHNEVFQDLIERMSHVNRTVCIRRAIMKNERLTVLIFLEHLPIQPHIFPFLQAFRLVDGQIGLHWERGLEHIHGLLVTCHMVQSPFRGLSRHNPCNYRGKCNTPIKRIGTYHIGRRTCRAVGFIAASYKDFTRASQGRMKVFIC